MGVLELLDQLDPLQKTLWYIAIPTSFIFIIQTILTFIGMDASEGLDADFDGNLTDNHEPFQLFSLRNLINFLLGFSWAGISFYNTITNPTLLVLFALAIGILFLYLFFFIIKQVQKLAEDNTFKLSNTLNKSAEVYLTIPGHKKGSGKILLSVKGSFHELPAMTEHDSIPSGSSVKIVKIESENILLVELI